MSQVTTEETSIEILDAAYTDVPGVSTLPETGVSSPTLLLVGLVLAIITYLVVYRLSQLDLNKS